MKIPRRTGFIAAASALVTFAVVSVVSVALAGSGNPPTRDAETIAEGPAIDFCPTLEQTEAHLAEYGFDYKPTVECAEDGQEVTGGTITEDTRSESEVLAGEKAALMEATRGPEKDGDPSTMEIIYADGTESVIIIQTGDPKYYKDMTPAEFAKLAYP